MSGLLTKPVLINMLAIAVGAAVGANARYGITLWVTTRWGAHFPYATLFINVLGSFLIGVVMTLAIMRLSISEPMRLLLVTGLLGGFTTFSSFSYEVLSLANGGHWRAAGMYVLASVVLGLIGVVLGVGVVRALP